jgi:hypothetical protein
MEHFAVLDEKAHVVAQFADGTPAAYENGYGKGSAILLGTFAGQFNEQKPAAMHPLGDILASWAGLRRPELKAPGQVELREMEAEKGRLLFLFNHGEKAAEVDFAEQLEHPAVRVREIVTEGPVVSSGKRFQVRATVPPQAVRIYRVDY